MKYEDVCPSFQVMWPWVALKHWKQMIFSVSSTHSWCPPGHKNHLTAPENDQPIWTWHRHHRIADFHGHLATSDKSKIVVTRRKTGCCSRSLKRLETDFDPLIALISFWGFRYLKTILQLSHPFLSIKYEQLCLP